MELLPKFVVDVQNLSSRQLRPTMAGVGMMYPGKERAHTLVPRVSREGPKTPHPLE